MRDNIAKMTLLPKLIYRSQAIFIKIPADFFTKIEKLILVLLRHFKNLRIAKTILREKNKVGELTLLDFTSYCKARLINAL